MKKEMICISGNIAVGKTEVASKLAKKLGYEVYKASEAFRKLARENNMDLVTFNEYVKENPDIDRSIENTTKQVVETKTNIIIDARLGFFMSEGAFKVYMVADIDTAASRLFIAAKNRGKEEEYASEAEAKHAIEVREAAEKDRYEKLYNVDIHDENNYDYVIDTTHLNSDEVVEKIIKAYNVWKSCEF